MQMILSPLMFTTSSLLPESNAITSELDLPVLNEQLRVLHAEACCACRQEVFPKYGLVP